MPPDHELAARLQCGERRRVDGPAEDVALAREGDAVARQVILAARELEEPVAGRRREPLLASREAGGVVQVELEHAVALRVLAGALELRRALAEVLLDEVGRQLRIALEHERGRARDDRRVLCDVPLPRK